MNAFQRALNYTTSPGAHPFEQLYSELVEGLQRYWSTAATVLEDSAVVLMDPSSSYYSLEKNFFTMLFLYSYFVADIPPHRRTSYVAVNQCLRGMVTGCDNILDDEYKQTLDTDLPPDGHRFRSVLDIMVSDRVLFELLLDECRDNGLTIEQVRAANAASLRALAASGAQEASEERGVKRTLSPDDVLQTVHHHKTGLLFQCPWALPAVIENIDERTTRRLTNALYHIGMGCQILDDMVDLPRDLLQQRHNYIISSITYGDSEEERDLLRRAQNNAGAYREDCDFLSAYPCGQSVAATAARTFLETGTQALYNQEHSFLVEPTIQFIARQIGADRYLYP
jgi:hypothetical protein